MSSSSSSTNQSDVDYSSTESEALECLHIKDIPIEDFCFLLTRCKFFSDPDKLVFYDKVFVVSNDIVLYYILLIDYSKILSLVDKKIKKHINSLTDNKDIVLVYIDKLCNINILEVVKAYKQLSYVNKQYLFISKCYYPSKEDKEDFLEMFTDYKESLEVLPVRIEELFLNTFSKKKNFTVCNVPYQMHLVEYKNLEKYIEVLDKEVE